MPRPKKTADQNPADVVALEQQAKLLARLKLAEQQRDFLLVQLNSMVQRYAGAQVAAGLLDMAGAQGLIVKESLPVNQALVQIATAEASE